MSDFLAEARILVRPDTSAFRAELEAQLRAVTSKPIVVPVAAVASSGVTGLASATTQLTAANAGAVVSTEALTAAQTQEAAAATRATAAQTAHSAALGQGVRGAGASALTLFGLRGATLAASGAFLAGTAAVVAFSKSVASAAALETQLNVFRVTASATADEMERVAAAAAQLGRDITLPGVGAGDAAQAMTELAKAGLSVQDALSGARGVLQLATAAQIDNVEATRIVAGALNAFSLAGTEAVRVADLLTGAAQESQGEIGDMATGFAQAAAVANSFGVSIEDTVTLLTQLAQAGIAGGRAGTSLRVAFLRLVNPTAEAAKLLDRLNVEIRDAAGNLRPEIFTDIQKSLEGYTKAQQQATLATIFGSDAIRTAVIIGNKGAAAFEDTRAAITEQGLAAEAASARTSGLAGDMENLSNQMSALGLTIGNLVKGPLGVLVRTLAANVSTINDFADGLVDLGSKVKAVGSDLASAVPFADQLGGAFEKAGDAAKLSLFPALIPIRAAVFGMKQLGLGADESGDELSVFGGIADSVTESVNELAAALKESARQLRTTLPTDAGLGVKQLENIVTGFDAQEVRARIADSNQELLDVLGREQLFLERQLQRQFVQRRPALQRALEQSLLGVVSDIRGIQAQAKSDADKLKRDAEQAARDAATAVRAQEQDLLAQFGLARDQQQNKIAAAAATAQLTDDVAQQKRLAALVRTQIAAVRERISVEGGRKAAVVALQAVLQQVNQSLVDLATQQQQAQEAQRQALLQSISLDVELAQITENQTAEVQARNRKIAVLNKALKDEARLHGKNTVAYKEIRNQIAAERAAIEAIAAEKRKENNAFATASFEFLQSQQGFASSLLGNLIPSGATSGLVGGGQAPVQVALQPVAGAAEARSTGGPTAGQGNATNHLLNQILNQLKELNGETKAPEARRQHAWSLTTLDYT